MLALTAAGLGLRTWGLGFLLPHDLEPDARILQQFRVLRGQDPAGREDHQFGQYPLLLARFESLLPAPSLEDPRPPARSVDEHRERAAALALHGRRIVAFLSALLVPVTYLFARRFAGPWTALLAALFVAVSPLHLSYSQQARPHAPSAVLYLLAVYASMSLARSGRAAAWVLAGGATALAVGVLQSGVATLIPLAAACAMRLREDGRRAVPGALAAVAIAALAIPWFYPFLLELTRAREPGQLAVDGPKLLQAGHVIYLDRFDGGGFRVLRSTFWSYEPWLLVAGALGALLVASDLARRRARWTREGLVALSFAIPYAVVIGMYGRSYPRFCAPLLPFAALLAGLGVVRVLAAARARLALPLAVPAMAAVLALLVLLPVATGARQSWLRARPDTQSLAATWIEDNLRTRDRIVVFPRVFLPLFWAHGDAGETRPGEPERWTLRWGEYETLHRAEVAQRYDLSWLPLKTRAQRALAMERPEALLEPLEADYYVLQTMPEPRISRSANRVVAHVRAHCERVTRISPDLDPGFTEAYLSYDDPPPNVDEPHRLLRLWMAERFGPVIEIYRASPRKVAQPVPATR